MRPEFWTDETLAELPDAVRLCYIGLWGIADDAGWLEWRPTRIGALLYPYRSAKRREADLTAWGASLAKAGRLRLLECGCAVIPTLPRHQRISGKQSFTARDSHQRHTGSTPLLSVSGSEQPVAGDSPVTERNVTVGNGTVGAFDVERYNADVEASFRARQRRLDQKATA